MTKPSRCQCSGCSRCTPEPGRCDRPPGDYLGEYYCEDCHHEAARVMFDAQPQTMHVPPSPRNLTPPHARARPPGHGLVDEAPGIVNQGDIAPQVLLIVGRSSRRTRAGDVWRPPDTLRGSSRSSRVSPRIAISTNQRKQRAAARTRARSGDPAARCIDYPTAALAPQSAEGARPRCGLVRGATPRDCHAVARGGDREGSRSA